MAALEIPGCVWTVKPRFENRIILNTGKKVSVFEIYLARADPGFSERGFGQTSAHIILLLLYKSIFYKKK